MTNQAEESLLQTRAFVSLAVGRSGAVLACDLSISKPLERASRLSPRRAIAARRGGIARAFESLEDSAGNQESSGNPRMVFEVAERMKSNGGRN